MAIPRAGLLDGSDYRQAQRDVAAHAQLFHIAQGIDALVAMQQQQLTLLTDMAAMMWRAEQARQTAV